MIKHSLPNLFLTIFSEIAIPTALANPCPNGPVVVSIPGISFTSGCPAVGKPIFLKFLISSKFMHLHILKGTK